jgi:hypothetical protein
MMTSEQGFRMVTRALAIYSLFWLVEEILLSPADVMGLLHHIRLLQIAHDMNRYIDEETYWVRYYAWHACERAIKIGLSFWAVIWFYRGSSQLKKFFLSDEPQPVE